MIPGTRIRFGIEPIIGLIPIFGDQVTSLMSAALLYRSVQHRLPKIALVRMALNILINAVVGMVPFFGDIFVLWYKPNIRNYKILQRYAGQTNAVTGRRLAVCLDSDRFDLLSDCRGDAGFGLCDPQPISLVVVLV